MMEEELVTLKKALESRKQADKELIAFLKKDRDHYKSKQKAEKVNILADLIIEEKRSLRAQYQVQAEDEKEAIRVAESDMRGYIDIVNTLRDRVSIIQVELEFRKEKVKKTQEQFEEWQDYINSLNIQLNTKITKLDIEKEELQRARNQIQQLEKMVQMLERNNKLLVDSNGMLLQNNTLFHYKLNKLTC